MPCSWATGTQKDVWQRLYNSLPFPEVLSFPCERWISMVIHFKNKDQSVSMSVPKTKSITLTALNPPRWVRQHFMDDVNSQPFFLSHCHTEALSGLQHGILAYMVFPIPVYIMSEKRSLQMCCLWQKLWIQPYAAEPGAYINRNSGPLLSMFN